MIYKSSAAKYELKEYDAFVLHTTITDLSGNVVDLTGLVMAAQLDESVSKNQYVLDIEVTNAKGGQILLTSRSDVIPSGHYIADILFNPDDSNSRHATNDIKVTVHKARTKPAKFLNENINGQF